MAARRNRIASSISRKEHTSPSSPDYTSEQLPTPISPPELFDSDKENSNPQTNQNRDSHSMSISPSSDRNARNKKRKVNETQISNLSQAAHERELEKRVDRRFYDPDQNIEERRATKKGLRNLITKLNDSRAEYLQAESKGLLDTLERADELYQNVKQTSDATIDSRLLVATADLSYKKVQNLALGESSSNIDVDEFVTRCISFMRTGDDATIQDHEARTARATNGNGQRQRREQTNMEDGDEDDEAMNWEHLGRNVCLLYNSRPCLSGFLLGPLSVQKKIRQQSQRRAREGRLENSQLVRPVELGDEDLEKQEAESLTVICAEVARLLNRTQTQGQINVEKEYDDFDDHQSEKELHEMMRRHGLADNGCVPLFDFCVNPKSFGQTVENFFYISFLIKEGKVGLDFDSNGMPTLGLAEQRSLAERQETQRNQAIFTLDFDTWEDIVQSCGIEKSVIPHRKDETHDDGTIGQLSRSRSEEDSDAYG